MRVDGAIAGGQESVSLPPKPGEPEPGELDSDAPNSDAPDSDESKFSGPFSELARVVAAMTV